MIEGEGLGVRVALAAVTVKSEALESEAETVASDEPETVVRS